MAAKKHIPAVQLSPDDEAQIQSFLARRQEIAQKLHTCTTRAQAEALIADINAAGETVQLGLLKSLVRASDPDAADLLLALHELAAEKAVRKEARRGLLQLAGTKVYPSWTPQAEPPAVGAPTTENAPRFWQGLVSLMREAGELRLLLCWEQGVDYGEARLYSFLLDFWSQGVREFTTKIATKRQIEATLREIQQATRMNEEDGPPVPYVPCTLAEGRRLLNEALDVNRWRQVETPKDFRAYLAQIQRLILDVPTTEAGEDSGQTFISHDQEPDMIAANFIGAWSLGDFGLCYDLLTSQNALHAGQAREAWIELRRNWSAEAHPTRIELYFLRELEQAQQSSIWLPSSVLGARASRAREVEICWSLELAETPLSGTLPEMPMGTAVYRETSRYWFWTIYTLEQENGEWRIGRVRDEGAQIQAFSDEELRKRLQEHNDAIEKIMREHGPSDPHIEQSVEEIVWRTWKMLALYDALLVKNPLDKQVYEDAYGRSMGIRAVERAAVYAGELVRRFPGDPDAIAAQQRLAAVQVAVGERFASLRLNQQAEHFMKLGEETLRASLSEQAPLGYLLLAELLIGREEFDEAERLLQTAREFMPEREEQAQVLFDLANLTINRQRFADAQQYLEQLAELAPDYPSLWYALGYVHSKQDNLAEAEHYYRKALAANPTDVHAYAELAGFLMNQERLNEARDLLAQGIDAVPQSGHLRALMAMVYVEKKDRRRAQEYLNEAERLNPDLELIPAIRDVVKKL